MTSLKQRVVAVAAANKHTAILTDAGAIFSWGANDQGQLGYGTSDSASNAVPRQVEAMKVHHLSVCLVDSAGPQLLLCEWSPDTMFGQLSCSIPCTE